MNIVQQLRAEDLTVQQLQQMVGPKFTQNTKWMKWDELASLPSWRELFTKPNILILLNIEGKYQQPVGHFIVLLDYGDHIEHFDSYGLTMEEELAITHEQHLTRIFKEYPKPIINNTKRLQTLRQDVNTCGRWCVTRIMLREMRLDAFLKFISYFHINPDDLVISMTMLLQLR